MKTAGFEEEVRIWINDDPEREALLIAKAPIAASTLDSTIKGRYNPGRRLERAMRNVMEMYPLPMQEKAAV